MKKILFVLGVATCLVVLGCEPPVKETSDRMDVIFDTDANNEVDDQHALAYLLFNPTYFRTLGITVNATRSGGAIANHVAEAKRIVSLCNLTDDVPVLVGADSGYAQIEPHLGEPDFDGHAAVDFIIKKAHQADDQSLVIIAVGKLTNVALALRKDPGIAGKIRLVWLGSNYPQPGEYNLENDTRALQFLLEQPITLEAVTVRYGEPNGTDAVRVTKEVIHQRMQGKGPRADQPVTGRHGGEFDRFGDYSISLFDHINYYGDPPARALFDMAAVAIVKNPEWGTRKHIPLPMFRDDKWIDQPDNQRDMIVWENFDVNGILDDFFETMDSAAAQ